MPRQIIIYGWNCVLSNWVSHGKVFLNWKNLEEAWICLMTGLKLVPTWNKVV